MSDRASRAEILCNEKGIAYEYEVCTRFVTSRSPLCGHFSTGFRVFRTCSRRRGRAETSLWRRASGTLCPPRPPESCRMPSKRRASAPGLHRRRVQARRNASLSERDVLRRRGGGRVRAGLRRGRADGDRNPHSALEENYRRGLVYLRASLPPTRGRHSGRRVRKDDFQIP